ncbi:MAG: hypothetical protein KGH86_01445 [Thaumarchaeota archaeon]|nr:hypothetical protein [Nitrososphaerota archaeon]MDE1817279.1 hypothetical protein [Nitrososphaerota archaeon]MDE1875484.1 hypothetical protein [Nitrososphaerota archaeon]
MDSETFGVEKGYGLQATEWMNEEAKRMGWKFEARLYNYEIQTKNFGTFEMFSLIGDPKAAREITMRASKRFKIKVIEGGYKTRKLLVKVAKNEYGMVKKGDRIVGQIEFESSRFARGEWKITKEERK